MSISREVFFDRVRPMFGGVLTQRQVDGMTFILDVFERDYGDWDLRWCAYPLATTKWETSSTMLPIEEYGKGEGHDYGEKDPTTGQTYYGRGLIQITWRENYAKADEELGFKGDQSCEWHADRALDPDQAAQIMFVGMDEGWFRSDSKGPHTLARYFNDEVDDPFGAREIINGDKNYKISWAPGKTVGQYIADDHDAFLEALEAATEPEAPTVFLTQTFRIIVTGRGPFTVEVIEEPES